MYRVGKTLKTFCDVSIALKRQHIPHQPNTIPSDKTRHFSIPFKPPTMPAQNMVDFAAFIR